jgi:hypothetical protein
MVHFRTRVWTMTPAGPELGFTRFNGNFTYPEAHGRPVLLGGWVMSFPLLSFNVLRTSRRQVPWGMRLFFPDFQQRGEQTCPTAI